MDFFVDLAAFLIKAGILAAASVFVLGSLIGMIRRARMDPGQDHLRVTYLNEELADHSLSILNAMMPPKAFKKLARRQQQELGVKSRTRPKTFILDFFGDLAASSVDALRQQINALLLVLEEKDEVLVRLESSGGKAHAYGFAAAQLGRLKGENRRLVVSIDRVAASGGYMMACVADHIIAAPFALVGSIGVLAMVPNFHRLLQQFNVDYDEFAVGENKKNISLLGANTEEGKQKFIQDMEEFHRDFKGFVAEHRPAVKIDEAADGDVWYGEKARTLGLVDELKTSDDFLLERIKERDLFRVEFVESKPLRKRLSHWMTRLNSLWP